MMLSQTKQAMAGKARAMAGKRVDNVRENFKWVVTVDAESNYAGDGGKSAGNGGESVDNVRLGLGMVN